MRRVAIVGAAGFIGNRLVESFHLGGTYEVVPVVRRASALALPCRFEILAKVADAFDEEALAAAFEGCDSVVSAITGDASSIVRSIHPVYAAAERAGVRRIVYLSSQMVHGQAPKPGTDERSALSLRQPFAYNRAKVRAEGLLAKMARGGRTEVVILRPGIVYGPRSQWTGGFADQLLAGEAFLADGGRGICNAIYVDNVVHAVERAIEASGVNGEAFFINDVETLTWRDVAQPVADALDFNLDDIPQPPSSELLRRKLSVRGILRPVAKGMVRRLLPKRLREAQRALRRSLRRSPVDASPAEFSRELALLHSCQVRLPTDKAERLLRFSPPVSFEEGCRRSLAWLAFAGYPVR